MTYRPPLEAAGLAPSYDSRQMSPLHKAAHSLALMDSYMGEHYLASSHWLYDIMCVPCSGSRRIGPRTVGPRTVGPRTVGPRTVGPRGPTVRGPTVHFFRVDNWAPDSWALGQKPSNCHISSNSWQDISNTSI